MQVIVDEEKESFEFISGKAVSPELIKEKLGINRDDIKFSVVWNDEAKLKQIVENKDVFINASFMDYAYGNAVKNIYYAHFPTFTPFSI